MYNNDRYQRQRYPQRSYYKNDQEFNTGSNLESIGKTLNGLTRAVKLLSADIKDIYQMCEERVNIPRTDTDTRRITFSHGSGNSKSQGVAQDDAIDEEGRLHQGKGSRRCQLVDLPEQGQEDHGRDS